MIAARPDETTGVQQVVRPRTFELVRYRDPSGVSGTGVVAEGCEFTDGSVALRWRGDHPATAVWPNLESILAVHGHQGATEVRWIESTRAPGNLFDELHQVRPASSAADSFPTDPLQPPPGHSRGWAGARHLR
ncbi:hypothetical protein [Kribbella sp. HUAS MG21]|uniref:Uncharacterized protein n=1 Tax=Kribbella sp. HUAS MG21 TaxID=3160966 RepID=A0AAU7TCT3_9ACTN